MEINKIGEPTPPSRVGQKPGKGGNKMDYVTARFCMDRLDKSVALQIVQLNLSAILSINSFDSSEVKMPINFSSLNFLAQVTL